MIDENEIVQNLYTYKPYKEKEFCLTTSEMRQLKMIISPKKKQLVYEDISQLEELIDQNAVLED